MSEPPFGPDDFTMTSTGRLSRRDDEIEPGDVVAVEKFKITISPRLLTAIGITDDMPAEEVQGRLLELFRRAAQQLGLKEQGGDDGPETRP